MAFDYKKEYKEFYLPKKTPQIVTLPKMNYVAVRGKGNPNEEGGAYQKALALLYGVAFTLKMSYKGSHAIEGYFSYVVPPLEGLWWMEGICGIVYKKKDDFSWISLIRLPEFVTKEEFDWAVAEASQKKKADFSAAEYFTYEEGLCVQCMHIGTYDEEPATLGMMDAFAAEQGYETEMTDRRFHHEIYISDPRRTAPEKCKTVLRHPIKKA